MDKRQERWFRNPFWLGAAGLATVLVGYALLASESQGTEPSTLKVVGRLLFILGLLVVGAASVIWFRDARAPEPLPEDEADEME